MKSLAYSLVALGLASCSSGPKPPEQGPIQAHLNDYTHNVGRKQNPALHELYDRLADSLAQSGILSRAIHTAQRVPYFELPNATGKLVKLSELLKAGPVILTWYRGSWCPYCNLYLSSLEKWVPQFKDLGAQLVAISIQNPDSSLTLQQRHGLSYHILSDTGGVVARSFGVVYEVPPRIIEHWQAEGRTDLAVYSGNNRHEMPLAATYIIRQNGTVAYAFLDKDHRLRLEPAYIVKELEKLKADS